MKTTKKGAAFIAALTATDALTPADHKWAASAARAQRKAELHETRIMAEIAYHEAEAAATRAGFARIRHHDDSEEMNSREQLSIERLIACIDDYLAVSFSGDTDRKERVGNVRRWGKCARTIKSAPVWEAAKARWLPLLQQEA